MARLCLEINDDSNAIFLGITSPSSGQATRSALQRCRNLLACHSGAAFGGLAKMYILDQRL